MYITQCIKKLIICINIIITINIIYYLLIICGLISIICPHIITKNIDKNYSRYDLLRGCGIYSITLGTILYYKRLFPLYFCFISSIIWHVEIMGRTGTTFHHILSILLNVIAFIIVKLSFDKNKLKIKKFNNIFKKI